jgi:hypothetical protein
MDCMDSLMVSQRLFRVILFTPTLKIEGKLEPMGDFVNGLNDPRRNYLPVHDVTLSPVHAGNPMSAFTLPELIINKQELVLIVPLDRADYASIRLLSNVARLTMYTASFAIQADFHLGGEMRERDLLDTVTTNFVPVTKAQFFPLVPAKISVPSQVEFALLNRASVQAYFGDLKQATK